MWTIRCFIRLETWVIGFPEQLYSQKSFLRWTFWCFLRCALWLKAFPYSLHTNLFTSVKPMIFKTCENYMSISPCSLITYSYSPEWIFGHFMRLSSVYFPTFINFTDFLTIGKFDFLFHLNGFWLKPFPHLLIY